MQGKAGAADSQQDPQRDKALLDAIGRRDRRAFTELYRRYHPRMHGYLRRILGNAATAEEVFDDVMFVVWTDARKFRGDSAVSSWIFGIAYRKAMTAVRKESRHQAALDYGVDAEALAAGNTSDLELINAALAELSSDHRQVVELTYYCGFSYQEISQITNCPVNTVKTRMFHARRRLRYLIPILDGSGEERNRDQV